MSGGAKRIKLGELLLRAGVIKEEQLQKALAEQKKWGGKLGSLLVDLKFLDEETLVRALSRQLGLPRVDFSAVNVSPEALAALPADFAVKNQVLPISLDPVRKILVLAMADPTRLNLLDEVGFMTGMRAQVAIAGEKALAAAIRKHYSVGEDLQAEPAPDLAPSLLERTSPEEPAPGAQLPAESVPESDLDKIIEQIQQLQARQARSLRVLVELLMAKGVFSLDEYRQVVARERGA